MGSFNTPEHPQRPYDQALEASILINGKVDGEFFLDVAALRSSALGARPDAHEGGVLAGGAHMNARYADAYYSLYAFSRYLVHDLQSAKL